LGRLFSKDKSAYTYLPESVEAFPDGDDFLEQLRLVGFGNAFEERQTFGIATVYIGIKPLAE
jgi:demethylmenaquinone methyltransferase/2-methoxy-6-polyprenyl-1,4-benzoquinol methylase